MKSITNQQKSYIGIISIASAIVLFVTFIIWSAIDFPFQDDVDLIRFIYKLKTQNLSILDLIKTFFELDNDHFVVVVRMIVIIVYEVLGSLSFTFFIYLNTFQILVIVYLFYLEFQKLKLNIIYFLPVVLLILQPQFHDVTTSANAGLYHITTSLLTFFAIKYSIKTDRASVYITFILMFMAAFTFGSGLFAISSIGLSFLFQKRYKILIGVIISLLVYFILYKLYYSHSGHIAEISTNFYNIFFTFFGLFGAIFTIFDNQGILFSVIFGSIVFSTYLYFVFKGLFSGSTLSSEKIILLSFFSYMAAAIFLIALVRSADRIVVSGRFEMFSPFLITCLYLILLPFLIKYKRMLLLTFVVAISFSVLAYFKYTQIVFQKKGLFIADSYNWKSNQMMFSEDPEFVFLANEFLIPSYHSNIWKINESYFAKPLLNKITQIVPFDISSYTTHHLPKDNHFMYQVAGFPFPVGLSKIWYILFENKLTGKKYICPIQFYKNGKLNFIKTGNYLAPSGLFEIQTQQMTSGTFDMYLLGDQNFKINKTLEISLAKNSAIMK
jgi:hypothetical protein